ncbi:GNAT family N-acetyltransferase [Neiella sp. HB171785]|uniref:GNAT family N-acetyltransferase n=1 Tax=Neiella litorisoli TaxID=2771431 RepID=A0A8J6QTN6_9GAMM|nr:GNAT family N-acetyltransferase [Neiella litorisoli]
MPQQALFPRLTTQRLELAPLTEHERWLYQRLYTDPKIMRNTAPPFSKEKVDAMFEHTLKVIASPPPKALVWVIKQQIDGLPIGIICFYEIEADLSNAKIGIMLLTEANGKLFPEEAMQVVMDFGIQQWGLKRITAEFMSRNLATARFVKKLGFEFLPSDSDTQICCYTP